MRLLRARTDGIHTYFLWCSPRNVFPLRDPPKYVFHRNLSRNTSISCCMDGAIIPRCTPLGRACSRYVPASQSHSSIPSHCLASCQLVQPLSRSKEPYGRSNTPPERIPFSRNGSAMAQTWTTHFGFRAGFEQVLSGHAVCLRTYTIKA